MTPPSGRPTDTADTLCGMTVPRIGLLWMALSAWGYATASLFARLANEGGATSWQVVFARGTLQWMLAVVAQSLYFPWVDLWGPPSARRFLVLRGIVGIGGLSCFYYAVAHMPLSDATVLMFTSPVWTCVIAWALLGERMGLPEAVSIVTSIAGICLIAKPTFLFPPAADQYGVALRAAGGINTTGGPSNGASSAAWSSSSRVDDTDSVNGTGLAVGVGLLGSVFAAGAYIVIRYPCCLVCVFNVP